MSVLCFHHAILYIFRICVASSLPCFPRHVCERFTNKDVAHWFLTLFKSDPIQQIYSLKEQKTSHATLNYFL